jgi:hypothetical protein
VLTTFRSYGAVGNRRQGDIIRGLTLKPLAAPEITQETILAVLQKLAVAGRAG